MDSKTTKSVLQKLLTALTDCTEWGRCPCLVLDALPGYTTAETEGSWSAAARVVRS